MVCVVLCGFVICWSPFQVAVLYSQFGHTASEAGEVSLNKRLDIIILSIKNGFNN